MKNFKFRFILAACSLMSFLTFTFPASAAPVRFKQVVQIVNVKNGKARTGAFSQLRLASDVAAAAADGDDDETKKESTTQDDRVIRTTTADVVRDDVCDCVEDTVVKRGFPKWALLGLAAIPIAIILTRDKDKTPTPTPTTTPTTPTPTPTPTATPTPTPTMTPTPTPPEPVPEPVTILLFGTGLAGIGLAARRKFGKKGNDSKSEE
jgi:hypothetical protein